MDCSHATLILILGIFLRHLSNSGIPAIDNMTVVVQNSVVLSLKKCQHIIVTAKNILLQYYFICWHASYIYEFDDCCVKQTIISSITLSLQQK